MVRTDTKNTAKAHAHAANRLADGLIAQGDPANRTNVIPGETLTSICDIQRSVLTLRIEKWPHLNVDAVPRVRVVCICTSSIRNRSQ